MSEELIENQHQGLEIEEPVLDTLEATTPEKTEVPEVEVESEQEEISEPEEPAKSKTQLKNEKSAQEENINFTVLRKARENAEKERDEYRKKVEEMEKYWNQAQKPVATAPEQPEDDLSLDPDDFVEGKHFSKVNNRIKQLEQKLVQQEQASVSTAVEMRLKTKYPDFDSVVSKENIDALGVISPEIFNTLAQSPDMYNKACAAYTLIKKFGINMENPYSAEQAKIEKNLSRPRASAGKGTQGSISPLTQASSFDGSLSEERKKAIYQEMCKYSN